MTMLASPPPLGAASILVPTTWRCPRRALLGPDALIGFSAGTPAEARDAEWAGADYLGTGAAYGTSSKADAGTPIGVDGLERVIHVTRLPVVAIGGIAPGRAAPCIAAGAAGVAVITAVTLAADVEDAARPMRRGGGGARRAARARSRACPQRR